MTGRHSNTDMTIGAPSGTSFLSKSLYAGCGVDQRCHCMRYVLNTQPLVEEHPENLSLESDDSNLSLDERLTTAPFPLSVAERRKDKLVPIKLYKNKVDRIWHKRYNYVLPEDQQFDLQPFDEIQHRDEEIALEYFYGDLPPSWLLDNSKEAQDSRTRILHRYNKEKRLAEEALTEVTPAIIHTRVESIISVNRTRAAETSIFGPSAAEKSKTAPIISFVEKLCRQRAREKERQLHSIPAKSRWHFLKLPSSLEMIRRMAEADRKIMARNKFRRTIKVVRAVVRFIRVISIMSRDARHVLTEIHYFQENQRLQTQQKINTQTEAGGLVASRDVFDPNKYHFSSRFKISNEVRMILTKPWTLRSDEEVNKVVERLQELRCFVEYPVSFQQKLAKMAWLIEVPADLAIIREGHFAADFYFMLAGKAKMIRLHGSPCLAERGRFHTLRILRNGDAFGDESMSHPDSERTYSVITMEKSTLLSLSSVDYISMLLKTSDDEQAPEHILFLSSLSFLDDFPKQKLIEEGDEYIRNYYLRSGSVITECLNESEYIYVVKMGSCRVLVELPPGGLGNKGRRRSTYEMADRRLSTIGGSDTLYVEKLKSAHNRIGRVSSVMEFLHHHREDIASNPYARVALKNMTEQGIDREFMKARNESEMFMKKSKKLYRSLKMSTIQAAGLRSTSKISMRGRKFLTTGSQEDFGPSQPPSTNSSGEATNSETISSDSSVEMWPSRSSRQTVEKHLSFIVSSKSIQEKEGTFSNMRHAVGTTIEMGFNLDSPSSSFSAPGPLPEFGKPKLPSIPTRAELVPRKSSVMRFSKWKLTRTLVKGDFIGHEWVDLNRGPFEPPEEEMSLVSDGCEVIMMKRALLIKYMRKEM